MVITRVAPLSIAKISGVLYALIGFCMGAIVSLLALAGAVAGADSGAAFPAVFGVAAVIVLPLFYGGIGFVATLVSAWLYNLLAQVIGGIEIDVR